MLALTLFCQWRPDLLIGGFTDDRAVIAVGGEFLLIISWNFVVASLWFLRREFRERLELSGAPAEAAEGAAA